ncbi:MAG: DUF711 family protein [Desulfurococcales archaeon]|nr:DUF711 family protein [Desulfurococcales archaeon]
MAIIRAITVHVPEHVSSQDEVRELTDRVKSIIERCRNLLRRHSLECWGFRASFPSLKSIEHIDLHEIAVSLKEFSSECGVITAGLHLDEISSVKHYELLIKFLEASDKLYGSVLVSDVRHLDWYVECLEKHSSKSDLFTRLAVIFPSRVLTPYFPASTSYSGLWGISIALRYVDLIKKVVTGVQGYSELIEYIKKVFELCKGLEAEVGARCFGLDLSLSPWMDESIGEVVELLSQVDIPEPGSGWAVFKLNQLINQLALDAKVDIVGFNEVMLPIAEDNLLKKRVLEGKLRISDIAHLVMFCVSGVDMAAVYVGDEERREKLRKLLYDVYALSLVKRRSIGVRLIPTTVKPGGVISIEKFGDIPVADV